MLNGAIIKVDVNDASIFLRPFDSVFGKVL
jgi:hypothetical protein